MYAQANNGTAVCQTGNSAGANMLRITSAALLLKSAGRLSYAIHAVTAVFVARSVSVFQRLEREGVSGCKRLIYPALFSFRVQIVNLLFLLVRAVAGAIQWRTKASHIVPISFEPSGCKLQHRCVFSRQTAVGMNPLVRREHPQQINRPGDNSFIYTKTQQFYN